VEYSTRFGAGGGILGLFVTLVCWALVLAATGEFARVFQVHGYRTFFNRLLGRAWILFEVFFILIFLMVLAVVASAAGEILQTRFRIPYGIGILAMLAVVSSLTFFGRDIVTKSLARWTIFLYGMFVFYFAAAFLESGEAIRAQLMGWEVASG